MLLTLHRAAVFYTTIVPCLHHPISIFRIRKYSPSPMNRSPKIFLIGVGHLNPLPQGEEEYNPFSLREKVGMRG